MLISLWKTFLEIMTKGPKKAIYEVMLEVCGKVVGNLENMTPSLRISGRFFGLWKSYP
jgi:hypothetical protein